MPVRGPAFSSHEAGQLSDDDISACQRKIRRQPLLESSLMNFFWIYSLEVAIMASKVQISADRFF